MLSFFVTPIQLETSMNTPLLLKYFSIQAIKFIPLNFLKHETSFKCLTASAKESPRKHHQNPLLNYSTVYNFIQLSYQFPS